MIAPTLHLALVNFTNATGGGDIFLVACGVFLGCLFSAMVVGTARSAMSRGRDRELQRVIVRALADHARQEERRRDEETLRG